MRKVVVIGSGAREHALAWRLSQGEGRSVVVVPGNAGIAREHRVVAPARVGVGGLVDVVLAERADLVVVGPEQPLVDGVVDQLVERGVPVLGPVKGAARLEGEKSFMKRICDDAGVPTARWGAFTDVDDAARFIAELSGRVVVKADGLCAGKGVVVCDDEGRARAVASDMLAGRFGAASRTIIVEEFLPGRELSVIALCDGERALPFAAARDHKRLLDGDEGPNTGGMGAVAPLGEREGVSRALLERIEREVFAPVLSAMRERGFPYRGFLYAGLMLEGDVVRVLEFNVRFGDPEAQAVLYGTDVDLLPLFDDVARGRSLAAHVSLPCRHTAAIVCASEGYPDAPKKGAVLEGLLEAEQHGKIFYAGVAAEGGALVASGGRVLSATASGDSFAEALERAYACADRVRFAGKQVRRDIGKSVR